MLVTELGIVMLASPVQPENASSPMLVTELGMVMLASPVQPSNAELPMLVTELGIVVFLQPQIKLFVSFSMMALQFSRESYTAFPASTVMLASPVQPSNAELPMLVTELGMVMLASPVHL